VRPVENVAVDFQDGFVSLAFNLPEFLVEPSDIV